MLNYLLDTNACINYMKFSDSNVRRNIQSKRINEIAVCSIVKFEMFYGSMRSSDPIRSLALQDQFFSLFESLPFGENESLIASKIRAELESKGMPIGPYDTFIAAIALANDLTLVTHNTSEFSRVNGLRLEDWQV